MKRSSKPSKIQYNFSGKWEDVSDFLRKYSTNNVLMEINKESTDLFFNKTNSDVKAVKRVEFPLYGKRSRIPQKQEAIIMAWALVDLAYYIIKTSNDYRGKNIEFEQELYMLQIVVDTYKEREESLFLDGTKEDESADFFMYIWGFAGEQFKFQNPKIVFDNFSRDLYMLLELNETSVFDIKSAIQAEIGMPWEKVIAYLMIAWYGFTQSNTMKELIGKTVWGDLYKKDEFEQVVSRYTADYKKIQESALGRQMLYATPFVKTQKGDIVSVSTYLNFFLCEHCILWLVRDYFNKQDSQDFTNYFGGLFERYFGEILEFCLLEKEYERIEESNNDERADWKLSVGEYKFLVEQKSTVMRLSAKQQQTDVEAIKDFAKRTVLKAMSQLHHTEKQYNDGKYIKIILLYEDYLNPALLDKIASMPECKVDNDNYFWIVTIEEMEMLLNLARCDRELFNIIIEEKIDREINHSLAGKSIMQLLNEKGVRKNEYIKQEIFRKYSNIVQNKIREILV
ncbi:MAG: hypothetical protein J6J16_03995 [Lachnospiraceae bacterium]|nr:hypothetical protein [Lachnospiraceae bacterium]